MQVLQLHHACHILSNIVHERPHLPGFATMRTLQPSRKQSAGPASKYMCYSFIMHATVCT